MSRKKQEYKPDLYSRKCCFNCKHHLAYESTGPNANTVVCPFRAAKELRKADGIRYIGVDFTMRIPAGHVPCHKWKIDTNVPKGFSWPFLHREEHKQLDLGLSI